MSASAKKSAPSAPAKAKKSAAPAKTPAVRVAAAVPATKTAAKVPAKISPKASARPTSREAMLARVEAVRLEQRNGGNFDCFGRAGEGYCDQGTCAYHAECLSVSRLLHSL